MTFTNLIHSSHRICLRKASHVQQDEIIKSRGLERSPGAYHAISTKWTSSGLNRRLLPYFNLSFTSILSIVHATIRSGTPLVSCFGNAIKGLSIGKLPQSSPTSDSDSFRLSYPSMTWPRGMDSPDCILAEKCGSGSGGDEQGYLK